MGLQVDEGSDWDTTEAEDLAPPVPITPPPPVVTKVSVPGTEEVM